MTRKTTLTILFSTILVIVVISLYQYHTDIYRAYIIVFKKNAIITPKNNAGKLDGQFIIYVQGKISFEQTVKNGLGNGWAINYYDNGKIKNREYYRNNIANGIRYDYYANGVLKTKCFFAHGLKEGIEYSYYPDGKIERKESFKGGEIDGPNLRYFENGRIEQKSFRKNGTVQGKEFGYYEDGKLRYTRNWMNGNPYGDFYNYDENKRVKIYHAFDILGNKFYLCHYDSIGRISQEDGYVLGTAIYSKINDTSEVLKDNHSYKNITDLYITVANPPQYKTELAILVNDKLRNWTTVNNDNNTIVVKNAFGKKGVYYVALHGRFVKQSGRPHQDDYIRKIIKE